MASSPRLEIRPDELPRHTSFKALLQEPAGRRRPSHVSTRRFASTRCTPTPITTWATPCATWTAPKRPWPATAGRSSYGPDSAQSHYNLAAALRYLNRLEEALACYDRALELKPDYADAHANRGNVLKAQGRLDEAVACYRQAINADPELVYPYSNVLFCRHFQPDATLAELAELHAQWDRRHAAPLAAAWQPHAKLAAIPSGVLRLGFVSSDLRRHPVGYFLVRVLEALRAQPASCYCYCDQRGEDDLTLRSAGRPTMARRAAAADDGPLAEQIRADGIDILFDLAGHTADNRLLVFARKPAPIQITWIGYEGTTGLAAMDYLLADRHEVPAGAEGVHYREKVLRMPDGYVCYDPPDDAPRSGRCRRRHGARSRSAASTIRPRSRRRSSPSGRRFSGACRARGWC